MESKVKIALFASGKGSNAINLLRYTLDDNRFSFPIVITDNPDAEIIKNLSDFDLELFVIQRNKNETKYNYERRLLYILNKFNIDWVLLAGFMKILSPYFIRRFYFDKFNFSKIVNIHPSLLPKFKGLNGFEQTFNSNDSIGGVTIHHVNESICLLYTSPSPRDV